MVANAIRIELHFQLEKRLSQRRDCCFHFVDCASGAIGDKRITERTFVHEQSLPYALIGDKSARNGYTYKLEIARKKIMKACAKAGTKHGNEDRY